jgi:acyl carrier protein
MSDGSQERDGALSNNDESLVRGLIRKLVGEISPLDSPAVLPEHIMRDELGYDSVCEVELTFALEEIFEFESFVVEDSPAMETVEDLENFTLDMIAQGRAVIPTPSAIDGAVNLISMSARPS